MQRYSLTHLSNEILRRELSDKAAKEKEATAELLAHIAEFDARKLYLPAGFPSMITYCIGELRLSEEAAKKRVWVARATRGCPAALEALATGRVHLSGLVALTSHLSPETAEELLAAAAHKTRDEIERLLAERFPKAELPASITPTMPSLSAAKGSPGTLEAPQLAATSIAEGSPGNPHARVAPLSAEAFAVQFTRSREADERFRYAQDLLGHQVAPNDIAEVYDLAMKALVAKLERVRFGACERPGQARRTKAGSRHIPAHVKRAVWQRDGGQCTFASESGHRCEARRGLEFDHVTEFARGGEATVGNLRLRCRGHNQHTAERTFGAGFMRQKREQAAAARASRASAIPAAAGQTQPEDDDVIRALRTLGYRAEESRRALALCDDLPDAPPETRLRRAPTYFPVRGKRVIPAANEVARSIGGPSNP